MNEQEIIDELPPAMRMDLVRRIYGPVVASVPLFFGLPRAVLTEICMALVPLPALKGEILLSEGGTGTEMYCISTGSFRVTQHMRGGEGASPYLYYINYIDDGCVFCIYLYIRMRLLHIFI